MNLLICGFSGAGKSTLLSRFENGLDLDGALEAQWGLSVSEMFELWGESRFREREAHLLFDLVAKNSQVNRVIALGGGALSFDNLLVLRRCIWVRLLWLNVPFEQCFLRIKEDPARPLSFLSHEKLQDLYNERAQIYREADYQCLSLLEAEKLIRQLVI